MYSSRRNKTSNPRKTLEVLFRQTIFLDTRNCVCEKSIKMDKLNLKLRFLVFFFIQNVHENLYNSCILLQCIPVLHNVHKYHIRNVCSCPHYTLYRYNGSVFLSIVTFYFLELNYVLVLIQVYHLKVLEKKTKKGNLTTVF